MPALELLQPLLVLIDTAYWSPCILSMRFQPQTEKTHDSNYVSEHKSPLLNWRYFSEWASVRWCSFCLWKQSNSFMSGKVVFFFFFWPTCALIFISGDLQHTVTVVEMNLSPSQNLFVHWWKALAVLGDAAHDGKNFQDSAYGSREGQFVSFLIMTFFFFFYFVFRLFFFFYFINPTVFLHITNVTLIFNYN